MVLSYFPKGLMLHPQKEIQFNDGIQVADDHQTEFKYKVTRSTRTTEAMLSKIT